MKPACVKYQDTVYEEHHWGAGRKKEVGDDSQNLGYIEPCRQEIIKLVNQSLAILPTPTLSLHVQCETTVGFLGEGWHSFIDLTHINWRSTICLHFHWHTWYSKTKSLIKHTTLMSGCDMCNKINKSCYRKKKYIIDTCGFKYFSNLKNKNQFFIFFITHILKYNMSKAKLSK